MSTYYEFYLAKKTSNEKFSIIAPYKYNPEKNNYTLEPLEWRSRSFIDWEEFPMKIMSIDEMDEKDKDFLTYNASWDSNKQDIRSMAYICSFETMYNLGKRKGFRQGYVPLCYFNDIIKFNYEIDNDYDVEMKSSEEIAEMDKTDRAEWGKMAFTVVNSTDYIAHFITKAASTFIPDSTENYYFICRIC